jgi:alpha-tubulin suppressor-like RCC1 family protein
MFAPLLTHQSKEGNYVYILSYYSQSSVMFVFIFNLFNQNNVIHVAAGQVGMGAVTNKGDLYLWGRSYAMGPLSDKRKKCSGLATNDPSILCCPTQALAFSKYTVRFVACGEESMGAIVDTMHHQGLVYMWGKSRNGACGSGTEEKMQYTPERVMVNKSTPLEHVIHLSVGYLNAAAVTQTDELCDNNNDNNNTNDNSSNSNSNNYTYEVYSWGFGRFGILGHGNTKNQIYARQIRVLSGKQVCKIHMGSVHAGCVTKDGKLFMWGYGASGCLGLNNRADRSIPTLVTFPANAGRKKKTREGKIQDNDNDVNNNNDNNNDDDDDKNDNDEVFISDVHCSVGMPTFEFAGNNREAVKGKEQPHTLACSADGRAWAWYVNVCFVLLQSCGNIPNVCMCVYMYVLVANCICYGNLNLSMY